MQYAAELLASCTDAGSGVHLATQPPSAPHKFAKDGTASTEAAGVTGQHTPLGADFIEEKRVSNRTLKGQLGVTLRFPTYREGLHAIHEGDQTPFD